MSQAEVASAVAEGQHEWGGGCARFPALFCRRPSPFGRQTRFYSV